MQSVFLTQRDSHEYEDVSDFIFLALAYEDGWTLIFLVPDKCAVRVLIIDEFGLLQQRSQFTNFCPE